MSKYKVTFKRVEAFYESIFVEASTEEEAREQADKLSDDGQIEYDHFKESDILEDYLLDIEKV